jgi:NYN domain
VDRCALFVDAGYVLADGAMAVHGTRRRESVSWDYPGLLELLSGLATERSRLPLLRTYWYDSTVEGRRSEDHESLADLPGVKLRVAKMRPGRREGVESEIHRDLTTLARNKAVSDAVVVSAEEDLGQVISDVQDMGMRITLLHIAVDGDPGVSRTLRQECDDVAEISAAHLRPYVELISGAEPPRPDERDGAPLALRPGVIVNGNGNGHGPSAGRAAAYAQQPPANAGTGQQPVVPGVPGVPGVPVAPPAAAAYAAPEPDEPAFEERAREERGLQEHNFQERAAAEYGVPRDGAAAEHAYVPDYGDFGGYGPAAVDFAPAPPEPPALRQDQAALYQDQGAHREDPGAYRQDPGLAGRQGPPARPELPARDELYGAPVALPLPADEFQAERQPARLRQDGDPSGYSPGAVRDQFRQEPQGREPRAEETDRYQPEPGGTAQVRRLPTRGVPAAGPAAGQAVGQVPPGQPVASGPGMAPPPAMPSVPPDMLSGQPSGPHPVAPVVPMAPGGMGYGRSSGPADAAIGQPGGLPAAGQPLPSPVAPVAPVASFVPDVPVPPAGPVGPVGPAGQRDTGDMGGQLGAIVPAVYPGGQSGVSLADAVQSAHDEGQEFGESVARDAPALWLEAVLARKPRMPSDLEARLLQGSALPIDYLLHDEVRHALRRGFWDAMERARR